jgi:hypothetical protein
MIWNSSFAWTMRQADDGRSALVRDGLQPAAQAAMGEPKCASILGETVVLDERLRAPVMLPVSG